VIVLSLVLVIVAAVLLVLGVFQDGLLLIYLSISSCLLAMGLLGIGVLLRRREVKPAADGTAAATSTTGSAGGVVQGSSVPRPEGPTDLRDDRGPDEGATARRRREAASPGPFPAPDTAAAGPSSDRAASSDPRPEATPAGHTGAASAARGAARLSDVEGLGTAEQQALLDRFGDEHGVREASIDELTELQGIGPRLAYTIKDALG
jgi:hypothetical protein